MKKIFLRRAMLVIFVLMVAHLPLSAAEYPTKPISIVVTVSPGGSNDIQCRAFASVADKLLGQPLVVANKPGASGMIGLMAGAQAAPDGYTLTGGSTSDMCALEWEIANGRKPSVSRKDFAPLGTFTYAPLLLAVPANSPWKTLADLIQDAKSKAGHYAFGSGGMYRIAHVNTELFVKAAGLKFRHVPYAGGGPALTALIGNHVDFASVTVSSSIPLVRGNKIRILAVQSDQRIKSLPDVPALKELGIDAELRMAVGLWAPQKTPKPIIEKLRKVLKQATEDRTFANVIETQGDEVQYVAGDEWEKRLEIESEKLAKIYQQIIAEEKEKKGK
jgi:tripartite-type tricarboxylate transporter receptor subunit TctC